MNRIMTEEVAEIVRQYSELICDHNFPDPIAAEIVKAAQLKRIADSLEGIESHLESVDESLDGMAGNIDGCMSRGRLGDAFCITGNITAY